MAEFSYPLDSTKEGRLFIEMDPLQIVCIYEALEENIGFIPVFMETFPNLLPCPLFGQFVTV
jgi:hypothetical protein